MNKINLSFKEIRNFQRSTLPIYTNYIVDPVSRIIVLFILKFQLSFKPYFYTYLGLLFAIISSYFFLKQNYIFGAVFFQISLIFDCVDGYIARIQNSGTIFGVLSDGFVDFLRVFLNLLALFISLEGQPDIFNFFNIYIIYILFENSINSCLKDCENYFKNRDIKKNFFDKKLIILKNKFQKKNIRFIWFNSHEQYFLIFFVGPIVESVSFVVYTTIIISFVFLILKVFLNLASIKS